jgi:hypothetical protein
VNELESNRSKAVKKYIENNNRIINIYSNSEESIDSNDLNEQNSQTNSETNTKSIKKIF